MVLNENKKGHTMKKAFVLIIALAALMLPGMVLAAGTLTDADGGTLTAADWVKVGAGYRLEFIATDTGGSGFSGTVPAPTDQAAEGAYIYYLETDPGATAPTDDYDIALTKSNGVPVFGGGCADRDTANSETCSTANDTFSRLDGDMTFAISNNSQAGAIVNCILELVK